MKQEKWLLCPVCGNKTKLKLREDTILENFPLYCQYILYISRCTA